MRKKSKETENTSKKLKLKKPSFKAKKFIASICVSLFLSSVAITGAMSVAMLVYLSEDVQLGNGASMLLIYDKPASKTSLKQPLINLATVGSSEHNRFQQTVLPLGNGDLGASVYGETEIEKIVFNEKTLWTGGPRDGDTSYNGGNVTGKDQNGKSMSDYYYEIRNLLAQGDEKSASRLFSNLKGDTEVYGSYQCFGNIEFSFGHKKASDYIRQLDIDNSVATVSYKTEHVTYKREYFVSNPDNVFVTHLTADSGELNFKTNFTSPHSAKVKVSGNSITLSGELADNGMQYFGALTIVAYGGETREEDGGIRITGTTQATIYASACTDYADNFPIYRTGESLDELGSHVKNTLSHAVEKGYSQIKARHITDYKSLYDRFKIDLGGKSKRYTTDKLVRKYATPFLWNSERKYLEQLLTCYGRYLLISSSRENSKLPANLQGVWNNNNNAPWGSDYHINVNLQMNYWPAYSTNLSECAEPLVNFVDALREPGRITAKTYTGTQAETNKGLSDEEYGFIAHTECTPFGYTAPGEGEYSLAQWSPPAVAWIIQNLYDGYEYSLDKNYLARIYPIMKEAVAYFDRTLVNDASGKLVSAPSYSPEHGGLKFGTTYEQTLVWQLYHDTIEAGETLGLDKDKIASWKQTIDKLKLLEIGKSGQIKEWYDETTLLSANSYFHRHVSHLLGLYPGDLINEDTPEFMQASIKSLNHKCEITTGWATAQRINLWARTGNGNKAYSTLARQISDSIYPNLWDAHPPFQIDGNFGLTAGVVEMLLQSNTGKIHLLPALPKQWTIGSIFGLRARGNAEISMTWANGSLISASLCAFSDGTLTVKCSSLADKKIYMSDGKSASFEKNGNEIKFFAKAGETYYLR